MQPSSSVVSPFPEDSWCSVAEAASSVGVPLRTVHRWVKSGSVRSRADGRKRLVPLAEVQHQAVSRSATATSATPASAGTVPARTPVAGAVAYASDGELAARVFGLLEDGKPPADIVREERLAPAAVLALADQWTRLRAVGKLGERPLPEQVRGVRAAVEALEAQTREHFEETLPHAFAEERNRLERLRQEAQRAASALSSRVASLEAAIAAQAQRIASLESTLSVMDARIALVGLAGGLQWR